MGRSDRIDNLRTPAGFASKTIRHLKLDARCWDRGRPRPHIQRRALQRERDENQRKRKFALRAQGGRGRPRSQHLALGLTRETFRTRPLSPALLMSQVSYCRRFPTEAPPRAHLTEAV